MDIQYSAFSIYDPFMSFTTLTTIDDLLRSPWTIVIVRIFYVS
jgi:hypothetical protein